MDAIGEHAVALPPGGLPAELDAFLALEGPQALLIRGPPGTGKTSLAVSLLQRFAGERLFLTSRVDPLDLRRQFPWWLTNPPQRVTVIDSFGAEGSIGAAGRVVARAREMLTDPGLSVSDPAAEFLWLPPSVQDALSHITADERTLIVFDSWDALVEQFLGAPSGRGPATPDRETIERFLLRRMHAAGAHVVLVLERESASHLDYLVDGTISTASQLSDERLERWLTIHKLRRVRIETSMYPFTLEDARFSCMEPLPPYFEVETGHLTPDPAPMPRSIWPGSEVFAAAFGRLPIGQLTVIEMDSKLPQYCERMLLNPMAIQVLAQGGKVLYTPPPTVRAEEIYDLVTAVIPRKVVKHKLRIFCASARPTDRPEVGEVMFTRDLGRIELPDIPVDPIAEEFLRGAPSGDRPNLFIDSVPNLHAFARMRAKELTPEILPALMQHFLRMPFVAGVAVGPPVDPALDPLVGLAGLHIRVRERHGRALVYGVRPRTPSFVLTVPPILTPGSPPYEFHRVV